MTVDATRPDPGHQPERDTRTRVTPKGARAPGTIPNGMVAVKSGEEGAGQDSVALGSTGSDPQVETLKAQVGELKELLAAIVAREAKEAAIKETATPAAPQPIGRPNMSLAMAMGGGNPYLNSFFTGDAPQNPKDPNQPKDPGKPGGLTDEERLKLALQQQVKAQMEIKLAQLEFETFLMKEKWNHEKVLTFLQHEMEHMAMFRAAFASIREKQEQIWLAIKQKDDALDAQRIKVLLG